MNQAANSYFFLSLVFPLNVFNTKGKSQIVEGSMSTPGVRWSGCQTPRTVRNSSPENIPNKTEGWEVMRSFARADRKQQRQKALLTHPKPLNPRLWPLGARKCSNVGIKSQRADWCRYYAAGRLPRWGDTLSEALAALRDTSTDQQ